jgi:hypothetical protein
LTEELYQEKLVAVRENYETAMSKFLQPDDHILEEVMKYARN